MNPKIFVIAIITLISNLTIAQNALWVINGAVIDEQNKPLPFVSIYVNNTSISTITNAKGDFQIIIPNQYKKIELVASFVGFKAQIKNINNEGKRSTEIIYKLITVNNLQEVVIKAKMDKSWKRKWKLFENGLLGESDFANKCKILNPEVVRLEYLEATKQVIAFADEPLIIQNNALGFKIYFQMNKFESNGIKTIISGYKFFENILTDNEQNNKKFAENRNYAYSHSFRNFLVSLSKNQLAQNGFELYSMNNLNDFYLGKIVFEKQLSAGSFSEIEAKKICTYDPEKKQFLLYSDIPLLVFTTSLHMHPPAFVDKPYKYSQIILPKAYCTFTKNGWLTQPNGIILHDLWGHEGFSNLLPDNYKIEDSIEGEPLKSDTLSPLVAREMVLPSIRPPINEVQEIVMNKEKTFQEVEEGNKNTIAKPDYVLKISEADNNLTLLELLRRLPGLKVDFNGKVMFRENNTNLGSGNSVDNTAALLLDNVFYSGTESVTPMLSSIAVRDIKSIGVTRYGNNAMFGARGASGTIIINTK